MKNLKLLLAGVLFIIYIPAGLAQMARHDRPFPETVVGTIKATGRNSIDLYDEQDKVVKTFISVNEADQWHKGDHVRIDYWPHGNIVEHIRKVGVSKQ